MQPNIQLKAKNRSVLNKGVLWKAVVMLTISSLWMAAACSPASLPSTASMATETAVKSIATMTALPTKTPMPSETSVPTKVAKKEIVWPAQGTETITQPEGLDFGLKFKDGAAAYRMILESMIANHEYNGRFFQALLWTENPTVDQLLNYLRTSIGPDGRPYYFPFIVLDF